VVVVDARGSLQSGVFGEMLLTSFKARGGEGIVIDGCIRDFPAVQGLDLGLWLRGVTPNFHTQTEIFPHAVNVPIACANVFVVPGDVIVADDDGAVLVPAALAANMADLATEKAEWEIFSRMKLAEGGSLDKYYPLNDEAQKEYEAWLRDR
ncbi:MAG: ribonuclease activity regulator RraA, partial [Chloroflexi bacterium]|nr:ribonuclease activity regulator RraA [Chloroflexota bacterium]